MKHLIDYLGIFFVVIVVLGVLSLWYETYILGAYYISAGLFLASLGGIFPILLICFGGFLVYVILKNPSRR